jgi:uncharacterized membrane protein
MDIQAKIDALTVQINELARQQSGISRQLVQLMNELNALKEVVAQRAGAPIPKPEKGLSEKDIEPVAVIVQPAEKPVVPVAKKPLVATGTPVAKKSSLEEFIGKNIASKVGILVTIVGIFIGARYAIEHNLVNPKVRVISGYINGLILVTIGWRLKKKYEGYSAVLLGGGLSVLYFITFIAYGFYNLVPQTAAFVLMLVFTVAIVYAALLYNRVIIAHLAQVGAYAIPFLLSNNSGRYDILFSYITIVNAGILVLSFRKYWKSLYYTAFGVSWLIFLYWYMSYYDLKHYNLAFLFLSVFFLLFYATFLSYKLIRHEKFALDDIVILLLNTFIFYGVGYDILSSEEEPGNRLGLFTVINAAIHFGVSLVIRRRQLADKALYYLVFGLVIVFITIAIPVQLDGNWVTLLWTMEALLVFVIGRTQQAAAYEKLGVGLIVLSVVSLVHDWFSDHISGRRIEPFFHIVFLTGLLVCMAQAATIYLNRHQKYRSVLAEGNPYRLFYDFVLPGLFLTTSYLIFFQEINRCFEKLYGHGWNEELNTFAFIVMLIYSIVYLLVIYVVNRWWLKNNRLANVFMGVGTLIMVVILVWGLQAINDLATIYFDPTARGTLFGQWDVLIRYGLIAVTGLLLQAGYYTVQTLVTDTFFRQGWVLLIHAGVLGFLSAEYLHWTAVGGNGDQYRLGLSILWGLYALCLVVYGIRKQIKLLRFSAIALFMITLVKLFFYDLAEASTITKTVSFISIGAILLLVSYLYNRFKI